MTHETGTTVWRLWTLKHFRIDFSVVFRDEIGLDQRLKMYKNNNDDI